MQYARAGLSLAEVGGKLYAIGGYNNHSNNPTGAQYTALSYVEEYNPATDIWAAKQAIPAATANMAVAVYDGKIYIFGGNNNSGNAVNAVRIYNPANNTWTTGANMTTARYGCGATLIEGKIYVAGGFTSPNNATNKLEVYNPATNTWETKANLPTALAFAGVAGRDTLYVVCGTNGYQEMPMVYEYSPVLNEWLSWIGPNQTRDSFGCVMTSDGIYAIGGHNYSAYYADVEFVPISLLQTANDYLHFGRDTIDMSGNFSRTYTDLSYESQGFDLNFSRTYNAHDTRASLISLGWTFGFQGKIESSGNDVVIRLPNGSANTFRKNTNNTYTALDSRSTLVKNNDNTHTLTTKDRYSYGFNTSGYLCWMKDKNENTITITVNASGQVTKVTDPVGRETIITYSSNRISTITDPAGRVVTYTYTSNRLSSVTDTGGYKTNYTYNGDGMLFEVKDNSSTLLEKITYQAPRGNKAGRVGTVTDMRGNVTSYTYDDNEGTLATIDSNQRSTKTWYDKMLYPVRSLDADGKETRTQYNLSGGLNRYGEIASHTDRNGNTTYYERDARGNITRQINPDNSIREYTYDLKDNLLSEKDELGKMTFYVYDVNSINITKMAQPLNGTDNMLGSFLQRFKIFVANAL